MKILVPVKRVVDFNVKIRVRGDFSGVELTNVKMSMNPFDEISLEEAIRLREKGKADEIIVISCGGAACEETLRTALALGADRAILVDSSDVLEPLTVAKLITAVAKTEMPQLILVGKQSIDGDSNQVGQMVAALLDWPQATFASQITIEGGEATVECEIDGGLETIKLNLPCVITADLRLNEPRYATLPNIMKARKKSIDKITAQALGVDTTPRLSTLKVTEPPSRGKGEMVSSVAELVRRLRDDVKVLS